jgi:hypothetical protein
MHTVKARAITMTTDTIRSVGLTVAWAVLYRPVTGDRMCDRFRQ